MRKRVLSVAGAIIALGIMMALTNCGKQTGDTAKDTSGDTLAVMQKSTGAPTDPVARGKYLVGFGGCNDCHTPKKMGPQGPEPDETKMLSGHPADAPVLEFPTTLSPDKWMAATNMHLSAWAGPWGISYAANLTPDTTTGLGSWTSEMFIATMRTGQHMGTGRQILPPMPWMYVGKLTDEDLSAIFAYLQSIPAIKNQVPQPAPPPGGAPTQGTGSE